MGSPRQSTRRSPRTARDQATSRDAAFTADAEAASDLTTSDASPTPCARRPDGISRQVIDHQGATQNSTLQLKHARGLHIKNLVIDIGGAGQAVGVYIVDSDLAPIRQANGQPSGFARFNTFKRQASVDFGATTHSGNTFSDGSTDWRVAGGLGGQPRSVGALSRGGRLPRSRAAIRSRTCPGC